MTVSFKGKPASGDEALPPIPFPLTTLEPTSEPPVGAVDLSGSIPPALQGIKAIEAATVSLTGSLTPMKSHLGGLIHGMVGADPLGPEDPLNLLAFKAHLITNNGVTAKLYDKAKGDWGTIEIQYSFPKDQVAFLLSFGGLHFQIKLSMDFLFALDFTTAGALADHITAEFLIHVQDCIYGALVSGIQVATTKG